LFDKLKNIFSKKDVQYIASQGYGQPYWSTQRDEQYIKEAYNKLVWVYSCVSMISSCVSSVPWVLYRKQNKKMVEIEEHPILTIVNTKANNFMTSKDFFDLWATYLALQGKFFAEYNNPALPTQLFPLYPHFVKPIPNKTDFISGFQYNIEQPAKMYDRELVMWSKFNDPSSLYDGLSPVRALARTIDTENEAVNWNKSTLQNSAIPAGALSVINPSPELTERLRDEWISRYTGAKNAKIPLILNAEKASYVPFGMSPTDMDFLNQRKLNRIEICSAFGVPSQVVGDPEGQTYANYSEAVKAFWQNTIIPKYLENIKDCLNMNLVNKYNDNLVLEYNLDSISVLHESIDSMAERVRGLFKDNIISRNEAREFIGYDKVDADNLFYTDILTETATQTTTVQEEGKSIQKKTNDIETEVYRQIWETKDKQRQKYEDKIKILFEKNFKKENENVKKTITLPYSMEDIQKAVNKTAKGKREILTAMYVAMVQDYGTESYNELKITKKQDVFDYNNENIQEFIRNITAEKVTMIDETTMNEIKKILEESLPTDSIEDIASKIDALYIDNIVPNRSTLIARTETVSASNFGSISGAIQAEADFDIKVLKKWLPTFDGKTRDTHMAMLDVKPIKLSERFNVGGSQMLYPADMNGSAGEVCNCRCAITYVRETKEV